MGGRGVTHDYIRHGQMTIDVTPLYGSVVLLRSDKTGFCQSRLNCNKTTPLRIIPRPHQTHFIYIYSSRSLRRTAVTEQPSLVCCPLSLQHQSIIPHERYPFNISGVRRLINKRGEKQMKNEKMKKKKRRLNEQALLKYSKQITT